MNQRNEVSIFFALMTKILVPSVHQKGAVSVIKKYAKVSGERKVETGSMLFLLIIHIIIILFNFFFILYDSSSFCFLLTK